jgi:hypothetical protein
MYLGGDIRFSHSGLWVDESKVIPLYENTPRGSLIEVKPNDLHGGCFGKRGGVFMSIQQWLNDRDPHSVAYDYEGIVMGEEHLKNVKEGNAENKKVLTWRDAASLATTPPDWRF